MDRCRGRHDARREARWSTSLAGFPSPLAFLTFLAVHPLAVSCRGGNAHQTRRTPRDRDPPLFPLGPENVDPAQFPRTVTNLAVLVASGCSCNAAGHPE